jgi:hypothetical protein
MVTTGQCFTDGSDPKGQEEKNISICRSWDAGFLEAAWLDAA